MARKKIRLFAGSTTRCVARWHAGPCPVTRRMLRRRRETQADFGEPMVTPERYHRAKTDSELKDGQARPYSVVFKLQKQHKIA